METTLEIKYDDAEHAVFSMIENQQARAEGARFRGSHVTFQRAGSTLDTLKVIDRLYRQRKLTMDHVLVLRHYGKRKMRPDTRREKEVRAAHLWDEAMDLIGQELQAKGML